MNKPDKWRKTIAAMLATAGNDGASDSEREAAMHHAMHFMRKYGFTAADFEKNGDYDFSSQAFTKRRVVLPCKRIPYWLHLLAGFVSKFVGGVFFYDNGIKRGDKGVSIEFYGPEEQVLSACEIMIRLAFTIKGKAKFMYNSWQRSKGADYSLGYVMGLVTQLESEIVRLEAKNENLPPAWQEPGLICQNLALTIKLENWAKNRLESDYGVKLRKAPRSSGSRNLDGKAYDNGKREGQSHNHRQGSQARISQR